MRLDLFGFMAELRTLTLQSSDGKKFTVGLDIAKMSGTIKTMIENLENNDEEGPIPLPNVKEDILSRVINWCTHHRVRGIFYARLTLRSIS